MYRNVKGVILMRKALVSVLPMLLIAGIVAVLPAGALAQDDPPGRVARLNYTQGSVSFQVQGDQDWVQADPNRPLTTGDNIWADQNSRAEVHIDSTAIRLSAETGLSFLNLDDRTVQLQLPQGIIEVHLRQLSAGDAFEIDTPNLAFTLTRPGEYMVSTDPNGGSTLINVREGEGEVTGAGDSWDLRPGQSYDFEGTDQLSYDARPLPGFSDFEAWCQTRDQHENNSQSAKYVSRDVDGYYDLDDYGDWSNDSDYGAVWYPRAVAVDWQPYHVGHWVYIAPWGWTWVDEEPWGFAPFHYGRWALIGTRWGWIPGPVVVRPVYAPALVGFVGGAGFGLSVTIGGGFSGVAWFPLGPRDVFVPAYHCSPRYVQVVNITNTRVVNVTQVTNVYNTVIVNKEVTHVNYTYSTNVRAVTAVSHDTFVSAHSVTRESVHINDAQIRDVHVVSHEAPTPTHASYVSATAKVSTSRPAVPFNNRPVVANLQPRLPVQNTRPARGNNGVASFGNNANDRKSGQPNGGQPSNGPANTGPMLNRPGGQPNNPANSGRDNGSNNGGFRPFQPPGNGNNNALEGRAKGNSQPSAMQPNAPPNNGQAAGNAPGNRPDNSPASNSNNPGFRPFQRPDNQPSGGQAGGGNQRGNSASGNNNPNLTGGNPPSNNGSHPANSSSNRNSNNDRSSGNSNGGNNNGGRPDANNNSNSDRFRFSPPVKAKDDNYDVHPPLNQGGNRNESNQGGQPKQDNSGARGDNNRGSRDNGSNSNNNRERH